MAQSQRGSNTQKKKTSTGSRSASGAAAKKKAAPAAERAASTGRARTAAARSDAAPAGGRHARAAYTAPAERPALLDDGARHDIAGVVVAVLGVALLVAVLAPSTGVLTEAVSGGLHALLGVGAFLVPLALILWAVSFFVSVPRIEPARVATGLALVALAVIAIFGLTTPGCEDDPSLLFNEYLLADRGGYVGNGLAWLLLTLVGKVVGIVVCAGVAVAGLIVVGLNVNEAVLDLAERGAARRALARARSEERAAQAARRAQASWGPRADVPEDWAPTALFDPSRPLSRAASAPATSELGEDSFVPAPTTVLDRPASRRRATSADLREAYTMTTVLPAEGFAGVARVNAPDDAPVDDASEPEAETWEPPAQERPRAAERAATTVLGGAAAETAARVAFDPAEPAIDVPVPASVLAAAAVREQRAAAAAAAAESASAAEPAARPETQIDLDELHVPPALQRPRGRRARAASQWWDPADDWNRDDYRPEQHAEQYHGAEAAGLVPGVLPGAPTDLEDAAVAWCAGQGQEACQEIQSQPEVELELEPQAKAQDELEAAAATADVTVPPASNVVAFRPPAQARPASGFRLVDDAPAVPAPVVVLPPRGQAAAAGEDAAVAPVEPTAAEPVEPAAAVATPAWVAPVPEPEPEPLAAVPEGFSAPSPVSESVAAEPALPWEAPAPVAPAASSEPAAAAPATSELPWEAPAPSAPAAPTASTAPAAVPCRPSTAHPAAEPAGPFELPDPGIFHRNAAGFQQSPEQQREAAEMAERLQSALNEFGVKAEVVDWVQGPSCTTYMVNPGEGVRVSKFTALEDDIARVLARTSVRVYAPVPNTSYVGIEVSALNRQSVAFGDVLPYVDGGPLDLAIGLDAEGKPVHSDLAKLPHLLVSGTTGSGKSVLMNTLIMSLLMRNTPADVRLIMVDPKQVEFTVYNGIPHLVMPVVADPRQAAAALQWGVTEMDRRYRLFSNLGVRDLAGYNRLVDSDAFAMSEFPPQHLPAVVVFIDELADLMMVAKKDVEASIVRIAQLGRASGIHLVIATQSPRADVVTGLIRANIANRIALRVSKNMESRIIIDQNGAEKLLPRGDMLFLEAGWSDKPRRIQGCYLADSEIEQVVAHLKEQDGSQYNSSMAPLPGSQPQASFDDGLTSAAGGSGSAEGDRGDEPMAWAAAKIVVDTQVGSTSMLQRRLKTGYARAGRLMDMLEEMGVVGPAKGSKPRDVLIRDLDELSTLRGGFDDIEEDY